ncbi:dUTP diphosphatase [Capillibacterium thermochitinicola]|uniref:Deoxyuridine 5'-triphosphate nucleotidohydrolase n=1 Tax=Capillibacterium thermochitinicola TaxID=2699427 RepID=A0A8J6I2P6_9FIRM|nr:dUTP diphosphatase [Capillibacterium thermochitinicola]MBA2133584.1 dUTP diphosphatase [Capillibacterium thermochitinicola]
MPPIQIKVKKLPHAGDLPLPKYMTAGAAGMDLLAAVEEDLLLPAGEYALVPTGLAIALPDGYEGQIRPRSGLAAKFGVTVLNAPGTIDQDYRGEIKVLLINHGRNGFLIKRGDRIAQLVVAPVVRSTWLLCGELEETGRGDGGFGHTGRR